MLKSFFFSCLWSENDEGNIGNNSSSPGEVQGRERNQANEKQFDAQSKIHLQQDSQLDRTQRQSSGAKLENQDLQVGLQPSSEFQKKGHFLRDENELESVTDSDVSTQAQNQSFKTPESPSYRFTDQITLDSRENRKVIMPPFHERAYYFPGENDLLLRNNAFYERDALQLFQEKKISLESKMRFAVCPYHSYFSTKLVKEYFPESGTEFRKAPTIPYKERRYWFYRDLRGRENGPFTGEEMRKWFELGAFGPKTEVRCNKIDKYRTLREEADQLTIEQSRLFSEEFTPIYLLVVDDSTAITCGQCSHKNLANSNVCALCETKL